MILGAGCAGLSLAWNLLERQVEGSILVVDRRERAAFRNDRTWSFWDVEPTPFTDLATHAWTRWLVHDGQAATVAACPAHRYLRVRAGDVYRRVLDRLAAAPNVTLALGAPITTVGEAADRVTVATTTGRFVGRHAFDGRGRVAAPSGSLPPRHGVELLQHFLGQTIRADRPAFDPSCPTLMDFRVARADGPHFVYLLPLSATEALVENTYLWPFAIHPDRHRREIAAYLRERHGLPSGSFAVTGEEAGAIPMTLTPAALPTRRVTPIGLVGGAARPSSGYAFLRIQRQARWLADRAARREPIESAGLRLALGPSKYRFFDAVFLRTLADRPDLAPRIFGRMFARVEPAALVRFLSERSTATDDLQIIAALPKLPFIAAAARSTPAWLARWSSAPGHPGSA